MDTSSIQNMISARSPEFMLNQIAGQANVDQEVKDQFLTLFYKEMLKQTFKAPNFSFEPDKKEKTISQVFMGDLMLQRLALQMVESDNFSNNQIMSGGLSSIK